MLAADLWLAGGLLVLSLLLVAVARYTAYRQHRRATIARAVAAAPLALGLLLRKPKVGIAAALAALIVGGLLGRSIGRDLGPAKSGNKAFHILAKKKPPDRIPAAFRLGTYLGGGMMFRPFNT
jgi:hypothetical protein